LQADTIDARDGSIIMNYESIDKCWLCYNLVKPINEIKAENPCCMMFALEGRETELCSNKPTADCGKPLKDILKKMYNKCKEK
jgi:hypothetical protein